MLVWHGLGNIEGETRVDFPIVGMVLTIYVHPAEADTQCFWSEVYGLAKHVLHQHIIQARAFVIRAKYQYQACL